MSDLPSCPTCLQPLTIPATSNATLRVNFAHGVPAPLNHTSQNGSVAVDVLRLFFNGVTWYAPESGAVPLIDLYRRNVSELMALDTPNPGFNTSAGPYVGGYTLIRVPRGTVHELVINNDNGGEHPMHLHGHSFYVAARGNALDGDFDPAAANYFDPPPLRDTVTVAPHSYLVLRFVADNPGVWVMHCHIEFHMFEGLMVTFVVE